LKRTFAHQCSDYGVGVREEKNLCINSRLVGTREVKRHGQTGEKEKRHIRAQNRPHFFRVYKSYIKAVAGEEAEGKVMTRLRGRKKGDYLGLGFTGKSQKKKCGTIRSLGSEVVLSVAQRAEAVSQKKV